MRLKKTCKILQSVETSYVLYYWRQMLGEEFESLSRFLLPTDRLACCYPRFDYWRDYRIVIHDDGRIVGINDEDYTDRLKLEKRDIVLYKFDLKRFRDEMCGGLGLKASREDLEKTRWTIPRATWEPERGTTFPITLLYANNDFKGQVYERLLTRNVPGEILVTPTRLAWNDEIEQLARQNKVLLVPLGEIVQMEDDRLVPAPEWNEYLNTFRTMLGLDPVTGIQTDHANEFKLCGEMWSVRFAGKKLYGQNLLGFRYLNLLFAKPDQPIFAYDLRRLAGGADGQDGENSAKAEETVDRAGLKKIEERYRRLQADLEKAEAENDSLVRREVEAELDQIIEFLRKNKSKHGIRKTNGNEQEKARISISKAVSKAMKVFESRMPELHDHLERSLEIGVVCNYRPDRTVTWNL